MESGRAATFAFTASFHYVNESAEREAGRKPFAARKRATSRLAMALATSHARCGDDVLNVTPML